MSRTWLMCGAVCFCLGSKPAAVGENKGIGYARIFASSNGEYAARLAVDRHSLRVVVKAALVQPRVGGPDRTIWERRLDYVPDRILVSDRGDVVGLDWAIAAGHWNSLVIFDRAGRILTAYELEDFLSEEDIENRIPVREGGYQWRRRASFEFSHEGERGGRDHLLVRFDWGKRIAFDLQTGQMLQEDDLHPEAVHGWPLALAGRKLQFFSDSYALYGNDTESAKAIRSWLDGELAAFGGRWPLPDGRGLVLTLETRLEPYPALAEWCRANIDRSRVIYWISDDRRGHSARSKTGRPYSFFRELYFRESFALPREEALRIGVADASMREPAWICALTTDIHVTTRFNEKICKHEKEMLEKAKAHLKKLPPEQRLPHWIFYGAYKLCRSAWRSIDVRMMRLQRREALWQALIQNGPMQKTQQAGVLSQLRDEIDEAWKELYFSRPTD